MNNSSTNLIALTFSQEEMQNMEPANGNGGLARLRYGGLARLRYGGKHTILKNKSPRQVLIMAAFLAFVAVACTPVAAQQGNTNSPPQDDTDATGAETNPTKPVLFSFRDEYFDLGRNLWQNVVTFRADQIVLNETELPGHAKGFITRFDVPIVSFYNGVSTTTGLGDLYSQVILLPKFSPTFLVAVGTGLIIPTATQTSLGRGKWIASPAVIPAWFFPGEGYCYIKVQDWVSFAGNSDRADVHYMTVTPTFLWRLSRQWWTLLDTESNTDWTNDNRTSVKAGGLLGYMLSPRTGASLKFERFFGENRQVDWAVRAVVFVTRF